MTSSTATLLHFNDLNEGSTSASIIDTSRVKEKIVVSKLVISCVWRPLFYLLISFQPGDIVLVVYEPKYSQHILYSTTQTIYFLHNDSLHDFQLKKTGLCFLHSSSNPLIFKINFFVKLLIFLFKSICIRSTFLFFQNSEDTASGGTAYWSPWVGTQFEKSANFLYQQDLLLLQMYMREF